MSAHAAARRRSRIAGRRRAMALRRRRRQVGASTRTAPRRANGSRRVPSRSATRSGRPSTRPQDCHSATMSSLALEENSGSDSAGSPCSSTTAIAVGGAFALPIRRMATPRNAATGKFKRHAHAAHGAAHHDALAMQIDDAPAFVGRLVGGFETHGQGEGVEPRTAARPGSDPAGFHLTPRNSSSPRTVAARLCRENARARSSIGLRTLVKQVVSRPPMPGMIDERLPTARQMRLVRTRTNATARVEYAAVRGHILALSFALVTRP